MHTLGVIWFSQQIAKEHKHIEKIYLPHTQTHACKKCGMRQVSANEHVLMHTNRSIFQIVILIIINRMTRRFEYVLAWNEPCHKMFTIILSLCIVEVYTFFALRALNIIS